MNRQQLIELTRQVVAVVPLDRLLIAGSQAYHGMSRDVPEIVVQSIEADILLIAEDFRHRQEIEDKFGMASQYMARTGAFAHPVGLGTITLTRGWEDRLVPFGRDEGLDNVWALEIHDLAASKLMAGREKDFEFLRALIEHDLVELPTLLERMQLFRDGAFANALTDRFAKLARHLRDWRKDDLARTVELLNR